MNKNNLTKISGLNDLARQKRLLREQAEIQELRIDLDVKNIRSSFDSIGTAIKSVQVGFNFVKSLLHK